ncbi:MAG: hypothetical protein ACTS4V_01940 [Candidatus Hodgkinia cicadicola]
MTTAGKPKYSGGNEQVNESDFDRLVEVIKIDLSCKTKGKTGTLMKQNC